MFLNKYKVIGILGGMGPEATVDLYNHIIKLTPAARDQDHIPTLIFSNPKVPDRTASIYSNESQIIVQYLQEGARILEDGGADFIVIPCNTAHTFYSEIQNAVRISVIHMIKETVSYLITNYPDVRKVGLLATSGTLRTKLFQKQLEHRNIKVVVPDNNVQDELVMKAIGDIKAGKDFQKAKNLFIKAIKTLDKPAQKVVIMGCTEIPLILNRPTDGITLINPTKILAEIAVKKSIYAE